MDTSTIRPLPRNPERWNDPHASVTAAVRRALTDGTCGPVVDHAVNILSLDEQMAIAYAISNIVISAYIADLAQRGQ